MLFPLPSKHEPHALSTRGISIRTRLIALVLAVLLPALCATVWVLGLTYRLERESSEHVLKETTRALSIVLDRELTQRAVMARALADSSLLDRAPDLTPAALRDFDQQARRMLAGFDGWLELRNADRVLLSTRQPPARAPGQQALPALVDSPVIEPMQQDARSGVRYVALVQPVLRNGAPVLNLSLAVLPQELQRIVDEQRLPQGWLAAIIDNRGQVVARHPGGGAHTGRSATPDLQLHLDTEREGLVHSVSLDGHPVTLYFHTSSRGWTYLTGMSRAQFEGAIPGALLQVALAMCALLVVALLAAVWVARRIVGPIHTVRQMALDLREGRPLRRTHTGLLECDEVALALHASHNHRVEALGRLSGGIAHEFNNLLGIISNSAHLLRRLAPPPPMQPAIDATLKAVDSGSRLTQDLLRFAGRQTVHPSLLHLQDFLPKTADLLRTLLDHAIELTTTIDPATPPLRVDPGELELSLIYLTLNAREALKGRGHLWLTAAPAQQPDVEDLPPGRYVRIGVRDDGIGMGEATARRAFEPFFSTHEPNEVAGLGLSQVYGFCQQAGGRARLESRPGQGTTVTLVLPVG